MKHYRIFLSVIWNQHGKTRGNIHASHAQNAHDGDLGLALHVKFVDEEDGQYADGEITQCSKCTVNVGHDHDDLHIHACALDIRVEGRPSPEVFQWPTLEEHEEHEDQTCNDGQGHNAVEEPDVDAFDSDAHQEDADGDLAAD